MELHERIREKIESYIPKTLDDDKDSVSVKLGILAKITQLSEDYEQNKKILQAVKDFIKLNEDVIIIEDFGDFFVYIDSLLGQDFSAQKVVKNREVPKAFLDAISLTQEDKIAKINGSYNAYERYLLCKQYYDQTQKLLFPISNGTVVEGKVVAALRNGTKVKIPVTYLYQVANGENPIYDPCLFGDNNFSKKKPKRELSGYFFMYRFVTKNDEQYIVLSDSKLSLQPYIISGAEYDVHDSSLISESSKLAVKCKVLFLHTPKSKILKFGCQRQFFEFCDQIKLEKKSFLDYMVSHKHENEIVIFPHPKWFILFICAFLFHAKKGATDKYPLHLLWISPRGCGKTTFLEAVMAKVNEKIIDGSTSTIKFLIPSFKDKSTPEVGELARSVRVVVVDEFLRMIFKTKSDERDIECARMNTLLEHKERTAGSGHGATVVKMTSRLVASTNPVAGTNGIYNLLQKLDDSFLSRMIIYYQLDDHIKFINDAKRIKTNSGSYWISSEDFLSIMDYLQSFDAKYDWDKLIALFDRLCVPLSEQVRGLFESRYLHHIECLLDGIIKTRCLFERDYAFSAQECDYEQLEDIMGKIVGSWFVDTRDILINTSIPADVRESYLPEDAKTILDILARLGFSATVSDLRKECLIVMSEVVCATMLSLLKTGQFIVEKNDRIEHYQFVMEERIG